MRYDNIVIAILGVLSIALVLIGSVTDLPLRIGPPVWWIVFPGVMSILCLIVILSIEKKGLIKY
jgi:hypothetical protein